MTPRTPLRTASLVSAITGVAGSVVLMLLVGRRNQSSILMVMFAGWVSSPFVAFIAVERMAARWPALTQSTMHWLMPIFALGSLVIYGAVAFGPPRPTPAFFFLVVPFVSWVVLALALGIAAFASRRAAR